MCILSANISHIILTPVIHMNFHVPNIDNAAVKHK